MPSRSQESGKGPGLDGAGEFSSSIKRSAGVFLWAWPFTGEEKPKPRQTEASRS